MSYDSDEEQIEQLKRLWKDYGQPAVVGVLITLVAVFGYKAWQKNQHGRAAAASALYQNLLDTVADAKGPVLNEEQKATVTHVVDNLQKDYGSSRYAALATLFLSQQQVKDHTLEKARDSLEWVLAQKPDDNIEVIVRVRLARVLLSIPESEPQKALDVLSALKPDNSSFTGSINAVRGDAYVALGQDDKAREAYKKAMEAAQAEGQSRPLLQLKLDDLATLPTLPQGS
ncbi:YfgM family protein [Candidatus Sororendozoicomonas aggregata]|uniref:YfgM family protein n=1 Tax=Candidatus Sororendozoicomonas aggregata TaxID=3073239 RepID=UPI002ED5DB0D